MALWLKSHPAAHNRKKITATAISVVAISFFFHLILGYFLLITPYLLRKKLPRSPQPLPAMRSDFTTFFSLQPILSAPAPQAQQGSTGTPAITGSSTANQTELIPATTQPLAQPDQRGHREEKFEQSVLANLNKPADEPEAAGANKNSPLQDEVVQTAPQISATTTLIQNDSAAAYAPQPASVATQAEPAVQAALPARKRNLLALTRAFVAKNKPSKEISSPSNASDDGESPAEKLFNDLRFASYKSHIEAQLQSAWKKMQLTKPALRRYFYGKAKPIIEFEIDKAGHVLNAHVIDSCGRGHVDSIALEIFHVASPLPPIPQHLGVQTFRSRWKVHF